MTTITLPTVPSTWTPGSAITYLGAVALLIMGLLASTGYVVPSGVPTDIQVGTGLLSVLASALVGLGHHAVHQSTVKAAIAAQPSLVAPVPVPPVAAPPAV